MSYYSVFGCWFLRTGKVLRVTQVRCPQEPCHTAPNTQRPMSGWGRDARSGSSCLLYLGHFLLTWEWPIIWLFLRLASFWICTKIISQVHSLADYKMHWTLQNVCTRNTLQEAWLLSLLTVWIWVLIIFSFTKARSGLVGALQRRKLYNH